MMTRNIILLAAICISSMIMHMRAQSLTEQAATAYNNDDFNAALELYLKAANEDGTSSELFYNIGNTYYKLDKNGLAILYYERALLLDPNNDDARNNLNFVNGKANVNIDNGSTYWKDSIDDMVCSLSSSMWGMIAVTSFILFIGLLMVYIFVDAIVLRKIGFFGGGIMLIASILANVCAFYVKGKAEAHNQAVVIVPSVTLSTSPRQPKDKTEEAFMLNEGTKISIVDSVSVSTSGNNEKWYDIKADDTHRAWINASSIEII